MLTTISRPIVAQAAMSAERALVIARQKLPSLYATGILGRRFIGPPIDPAHVVTALAFLSRCRKSKFENCHSFDLRAAIGGVTVGATIAAATALGFCVHSWRNTVDYAPHAMVGVNADDVERATMMGS